MLFNAQSCTVRILCQFWCFQVNIYMYIDIVFTESSNQFRNYKLYTIFCFCFRMSCSPHIFTNSLNFRLWGNDGYSLSNSNWTMYSIILSNYNSSFPSQLIVYFFKVSLLLAFSKSTDWLMFLFCMSCSPHIFMNSLNFRLYSNDALH